MLQWFKSSTGGTKWNQNDFAFGAQLVWNWIAGKWSGFFSFGKRYVSHIFWVHHSTCFTVDKRSMQTFMFRGQVTSLHELHCESGWETFQRPAFQSGLSSKQKLHPSNRFHKGGTHTQTYVCIYIYISNYMLASIHSLVSYEPQGNSWNNFHGNWVFFIFFCTQKKEKVNCCVAELDAPTRRVGWKKLTAAVGVVKVGLIGKMVATIPETNILHLQMDGLNTIVSFSGLAYFQGLCYFLGSRSWDHVIYCVFWSGE